MPDAGEMRQGVDVHLQELGIDLVVQPGIAPPAP